MARSRSLTNLIADVRQRTNMENSEFVTDTEITEYINQGLAEVHGHLTMSEGQPHFRNSQQYSVIAGTSLYALPSDFLKVQRVIGQIDSRWIDLDPFMEGERPALLNSNEFSFGGRGFAPMYRIQAGFIEVLPATRAFDMRLFYVQGSPRLVSGSDTVDGFNGYELAAIYDACATVLQKEESDPSFYMMQKEKILKYIDSMAAQRDASHPERVEDVTGALSWDLWGLL